MSEENRYTIGDLERMTGVKRRTVRFYIERGVGCASLYTPPKTM